MDTILVATDGSAAAKQATTVAIGLAKAGGARLLFVTAWQELRGDFGLPYATMIAPDLADIERNWAEETLEGAAAEAAEAGLEAETISRHGHPAEEICAAARERAVDLIAMGSHGWGPLRGLLFGSVSARVLHEARVPVLIVPEGAVAAEQDADRAAALAR